MKRSEVLQELRNLLHSTEHIDVPNYSYLKVDPLAEEILSLIEECGMQPPNITLEELYPNSGLTCDTKHYYAIWEKE